MKLGLFGMPIHPADASLADSYEADANRIVLADELGFTEAFIGEHQTCATEPVASPLMLMASVIHRTKNITLGSGVTALPMYHPAMAAATVAQFDNMARGRFIWGIGQGGLASDWEAFGVMDPQERNERMIESVSIIKELWTGTAPFHFDGKHYPFSIDETVNAELSIGQPIKPFQRPHPPIAATAMSPASNSIKQAVVQGWIPMSANFVPLSTVYSHWDKIVEGYGELGQEPTGENWRVARNVLVAPTDEEARARVFDPAGPNFHYFHYLWNLFHGLGAGAVMNATGADDDAVTIEDLIDDMVIYGSPETVARRIAEIRERAPFGTLLTTMLDGSNPTHELHEQESMRLLASDVLPRVPAPAAAAVTV